MTAHATGTKVSSYDIGKALALYFSEFLTGPFSNCFMEFANDCRLCKWYGNTPIEKWFNDHSEAYGSTNFQSVIDLFIKIKNRELLNLIFLQELYALVMESWIQMI